VCLLKVLLGAGDLDLERGIGHESAFQLGDDDGRSQDEGAVAFLVHEVAATRLAKAGTASCVDLDDLIGHHNGTPIP
jgi:hypothetical protein